MSAELYCIGDEILQQPHHLDLVGHDRWQRIASYSGVDFLRAWSRFNSTSLTLHLCLLFQLLQPDIDTSEFTCFFFDITFELPALYPERNNYPDTSNCYGTIEKVDG